MSGVIKIIINHDEQTVEITNGTETLYHGQPSRDELHKLIAKYGWGQE